MKTILVVSVAIIYGLLWAMSSQHRVGSIAFYQSADDVLVARHDAVIDTTTNGSGVIAEMTLEEIQAYEVGFHEVDYPSMVSVSGIKVPTLESIFKRLPKSRYMIEIKPLDLAIANKLCDLVAQH